MNIGNDCWNIINDYKAQLEHRDKYQGVLKDILNLKQYSKIRTNTIIDIHKTPLWLCVRSNLMRTRLVFECEYLGVHNIAQALEEFYEDGNCYYRY